MNRLSTRLVISHLLAAVVGVGVAWFVVHLLAPALFDQGVRALGRADGAAGRGLGAAQMGQLRDEVATAVDRSLLVGLVIGAIVATGFGGLAAYRLLRPLSTVRAATHEMARGTYDATVPVPRERELADLAADVNSLGRTLDEVETRRVRLLGEVAHEMRTPLTIIDGYVEGMIDGIIPADPEQLGLVGAESRRLRRLAEDLSTLSRAQEGRLEMRLDRVDLAQVARAAAGRLQPQAQDATIRYVVDAAGPLPVRADADRLAQVVRNLVGNAIRATPAGGSITVSTRRDGQTAVLEVVDTGVGLSGDDTERIFERFYRAEGTRRVEGGGSGIGLTISRQIMTAHGGSLVASSGGPGTGTTLTARLPVA